MSTLPPEIGIKIINKLNLNDISNLYLIDKGRYEILKKNENVIFKYIYIKSKYNKLLLHTYFNNNNLKVVKNCLSKRFKFIKKNNNFIIYANDEIFYTQKTTNHLNILKYYFKDFLYSIIMISNILNYNKMYSYCLNLDLLEFFIRNLINRKRVKKEKINKHVCDFIELFIFYSEELYLKLEKIYLYTNDKENKNLRLNLEDRFQGLLKIIDKDVLINNPDNYDYNKIKVEKYDYYDDLDYYNYYNIKILF